VTDDDDVLTSPFDCGSHVLDGCAGSQALVRLGLDLELPGELRSGLPRAEKWAREHGVELHAVVAQPLPELARLLAPLGRELPHLVRLAGGGLPMTD